MAYPQVLLETGEIETDGFLVEIPVSLDFEPGVTEDRGVITPRRNREVDSLAMGIVTRKERASNAERACSRDRLSHGDLLARLLETGGISKSRKGLTRPSVMGALSPP